MQAKPLEFVGRKKFAGTMTHGQDMDEITLDSVEDAVTTENKLSHFAGCLGTFWCRSVAIGQASDSSFLAVCVAT